MSKILLKNICLVMPIYQGRDIFLEGLDSVERADIPFNKIVLSFNGASSTDYDLFCKEKSLGRFLKEYTILRTNAEMSSVEHSIFITNHLKEFCIETTQIFLLAHDDRILNSPDDLTLHQFLENSKSDTIYFPSYSCCFENKNYSIFRVIESDQVLTSNDFFWLTQTQDVPTNMSGMIIPFIAWVETLKVLLKAGSGARFEHLICIARSIKYVCFNTNVKILVISRPYSDASNLNARQHRISSLYYSFTFFKNGRIIGLCQHLLFGRILINKAIRSARRYIGHR